MTDPVLVKLTFGARRDHWPDAAMLSRVPIRGEWLRLRASDGPLMVVVTQVFLIPVDDPAEIDYRNGFAAEIFVTPNTPPKPQRVRKVPTVNER